MSGKSVSCGDKKIKKIKYYKNKKAFKIYDININNILVSNKYHMVQTSQLNISLEIITMMTLNLYA